MGPDEIKACVLRGPKVLGIKDGEQGNGDDVFASLFVEVSGFRSRVANPKFLKFNRLRLKRGGAAVSTPRLRRARIVHIASKALF
jgi:hypothetical protein